MKFLLPLILLLGSTSFALKRTGPKYAVGATILAPTGVTARYRWKWNRTIDVGLGITPKIEAHVILVYEMGPVRKNMRWYWGLGPRWKSGDKSSIGFRIPIGIKYRQRRSRVAYFGEFVTNINMFGDTGIHPGIALGGIYYF